MADTSTSTQSGDTDNQSGNQENQDQQNNSLTLEQMLEENKKLQARLKETSDEAKKFRQTNSTLKAQIDQAEQEKLKAEGKWQELAEKEKQRAADLETELKTTKATVLFKNIETEFTREAAQVGCVDTRALIKLVDLEKVKTADGLGVDATSVKALIEKAQKEMSYLFKAKAPNVNDLPPSSGKPPVSGDFTTEMKAAKTHKEIEEVLKKHNRL